MPQPDLLLLSQKADIAVPGSEPGARINEFKDAAFSGMTCRLKRSNRAPTPPSAGSRSRRSTQHRQSSTPPGLEPHENIHQLRGLFRLMRPASPAYAQDEALRDDATTRP
ncbi:hypothetical protein [Rhodovulum sulfidophilum]|uniref:hypothetical protein n=1 Tax=Rhodovulum sulfidophilum TaxID=35806 RepID=UPI000A933703|nr:hypothetical protein [Rhodovulum sulfidophilum]